MLLLAGALVAPAALTAQVAGLPLRNAGVPRGLTVAADVGFPNDASGLGTSYGASGALGLGLVGITGTVARVGVTNQDALTALGLNASLRLIGGPLIPFFANLQAGAGRWSMVSDPDGAVFDVTTTALTAGLGVGLTIASPVVSLKPWLAPRLQHNRLEDNLGGGEAVTTTDPAISGGVDLGFINGLTVRAMYDRVLADGDDRSVWSLGLGYSLRILR
jgi:hypothetical protein